MSESLPPGESPGLLLWRVTLAWQRQVTAALCPLGLTHVQFVLLASSWWFTTHGEDEPTQKRVAEFAGVDVMMTSQVLRALEGRGLVTCREAFGDARARAVRPTAEGTGLARTAVQVVEAVDRRFFDAAGAEQSVRLLLALDGQ